MEQFKPGTVIDLFEDDKEEYMIIASVPYNNLAYLLVAPISKDEKNFKVSFDRQLIVNVDMDSLDMQIEEDDQIIKEVINLIYK